MDCCSKYPTDYTRPCHHTIPSVGGISGCGSNGIISNSNLYGPSRLVHPSLRYQSSLNRNGFPPPIGYDGFGPPPSPQIIPPTATLPSHPYQNYDLRYDPNSRSYSNFVSSNGSTPLYPYNNSNGFSYGHLNNRYYNHHYHQQQQQQQQQAQHYYDSYGRIIGTNHPYSYHHNYHTLRNNVNPSSSLNGSNSAYHHAYGHRHNSPYLPLRGLDYHIPPPTQYYSPHHNHHQNGSNSSLQHFNNSLYPSHSHNVTTGNHHNDLLLQQNYSAQQQDQSIHNNLTKDSMFLPHITTNTPPLEQTETNRYSTVNGMSRDTDIDCERIIEINSDKEINARCNSTQSIVNSPSDNSTIINKNNNDSTTFNSDLTVASSPLTNGSADSGISGCGNIGDGSYQNNNNNNNSKNNKENYDNDNIGQLENNENEGEENCENKQNIEQIISTTNDKEHEDLQTSDVDSTDLKETKSKLNNESEKVVNQISDSNKRKLECSTPLINSSPILERSTTPFLHHQQYQQQYNQHNGINNNSNYQSRYFNSSPATATATTTTGQNNNNYSPYYQNCYTPLSNRSNWSPYSSPHYNYSYNYSPTSTIKSNTSSIRKQNTFSPISNNRRRKQQSTTQHQQRKKPISKTSSLLQQTITTNKNRVLECDFIPSKKSKRKNKSESEDSFEFREEIKDIKPLPGFQQAFGSTEIGRFSEIFFNTPDNSPYNDNIPYGYESEADTSMSPYPWETGDSLEGPHINLHIGNTSLKSCYTDHLNSIINNNSPLLENNNYFSGIRCNEY